MKLWIGIQHALWRSCATLRTTQPYKIWLLHPRDDWKSTCRDPSPLSALVFQHNLFANLTQMPNSRHKYGQEYLRASNTNRVRIQQQWHERQAIVILRASKCSYETAAFPDVYWEWKGIVCAWSVPSDTSSIGVGGLYVAVYALSQWQDRSWGLPKKIRSTDPFLWHSLLLYL